jgi:hypothetical protein
MAVQKNFVIQNGLEVNNNLIFADKGSNKVGIATTSPRHTLHVNGGIGATNSVVTGISTVTDLIIGGKVSAGSTFGAAGQYLVSTGAGVTWGAVPTVRSLDLQTAGVGATTFNTTYAVGLLDVYVNGVKLSSDEFTANNGATVVLDDACFGGETIEFVSYSPFALGFGSTSIQGITILEEGSPVGSALQVTSINFVGAAVTAVGSGIGVTVYITDTDTLNPNYWASTAAGIHTLSNAGIGTTNPRFTLEVGAVGASGTTLYVNGDARITGILTVGSSSITLDGSTNIINVGSGVTIDGTAGTISATSIVVGGTTLTGSGVTYITAGSGISVDQNTGNVTITASGGGTSSQWVTTAAGIHTLSNVGIGTTNPTSKLTVKGNTSLETLSVSGVSTFTIGGAGNSEAVYFRSKTQPQASLKISQAAGNDDGVLMTFSSSDGDTATIETDSNSNLIISTQNTLNLRANTNQTVLQSSGSSADLYYSGIKKFETLGAGVTVTGTTFTNQLSVSGVSTLSSNVSVAGTISVNGGVKLATNNATIVGTSGTAGEIKQIGGAPFYYDGSAWREFVLSSGTPVTVPADTEWDNVVFRATFDTDFTDAKFGATPVYVSAGSTIVGAAVTIGTGAFRNDGTLGAGVSYAYRSDYDFTGSWTIEFWMYVDSGPTYFSPTTPASLISMHSTTGIGTSGNWSLGMYGDQYGNKYITWFNQNHPTYKNGTSLYLVAGVTWNSNIVDKWNHFALVREADNGSLHFYVNGIETSNTTGDNIIDNDILDISGNGLYFGGDTTFTIGTLTFNSNETADVIFDDVRISAGVGTAGQRYNSIGISTYATFTPPTTALPTTGTLSSYIQPPGDKYGEITLGGSPTWRGTSGVTVSQQSSGNYRVSFASTYTNANDYFVLTQAMDQGFASYVGVARSTTHVDFAINKESDSTAVNTGSLSVQIKNHI